MRQNECMCLLCLMCLSKLRHTTRHIHVNSDFCALLESCMQNRTCLSPASPDKPYAVSRPDPWVLVLGSIKGSCIFSWCRRIPAQGNVRASAFVAFFQQERLQTTVYIVGRLCGAQAAFIGHADGCVARQIACLLRTSPLRVLVGKQQPTAHPAMLQYR